MGERCGYYEAGHRCLDPAAHQVQFDGRKQWLCDRHARPEYHPPDLHKKLPGVVKRLAVKRSTAG